MEAEEQATEAFYQWAVDRDQGALLLVLIKTAQLGFETPLEDWMLMESREACWRLYRRAFEAGFPEVAARYYQWYEVVCRKLMRES